MYKSIAVDVLERIYKAKPGEIVDGKYVRFFGHYEPWGVPEDANNYNRDVCMFCINCVFSFKDLTDGQYWRFSEWLKREKLAPEDEPDHETIYKPLFSDVDSPAATFRQVILAKTNTCMGTTIEYMNPPVNAN